MTRRTGTEKADDLPSWAAGQRPEPHENGRAFADRLMRERYGAGRFATGRGSERSQIAKVRRPPAMRPRMRVYVLHHEHERDDETADVKLMGIYGSETEARAARERLSAAPGFREHRDGFSIDAYEVGRDHWTDGFDTVRSDDGARVGTAAA